jgi:hypothetical protein
MEPGKHNVAAEQPGSLLRWLIHRRAVLRAMLGVGKREAAPGRAVAKRDADELRDIEAVLACLGDQEYAGQRADI